MLGLLRIILPFLLALALPLQGIAATTMRFCLPVHPAVPMSAVAKSTSHAHGGAAGHGHHGEADSAHHHGDHASPSDADSEASNAPIGKTSSGTCSVCAACSAAALPAAPLPQLADAPEDHLHLPQFEPHFGLTPGGLERPPRSNLA